MEERTTMSHLRAAALSTAAPVATSEVEGPNPRSEVEGVGGVLVSISVAVLVPLRAVDVEVVAVVVVVAVDVVVVYAAGCTSMCPTAKDARPWSSTAAVEFARLAAKPCAQSEAAKPVTQDPAGTLTRPTIRRSAPERLTRPLRPARSCTALEATPHARAMSAA